MKVSILIRVQTEYKQSCLCTLLRTSNTRVVKCKKLHVIYLVTQNLKSEANFLVSGKNLYRPNLSTAFVRPSNSPSRMSLLILASFFVCSQTPSQTIETCRFADRIDLVCINCWWNRRNSLKNYSKYLHKWRRKMKVFDNFCRMRWVTV